MNAYGSDVHQIVAMNLTGDVLSNKKEWEGIASARRDFIERGVLPDVEGWSRPEVVDSWARCLEMGDRS